MIKKLAIIVILVIAAATLFGGIAYASDRLPHLRGTGRRGVGKVVDIHDDYLLISLRRGTEIKLFIDDQTQIHLHNGSEGSVEDLQVGRWVGSTAVRISWGNWLARKILLFPDGYEPPEDAEHIRGRVIEMGLNEIGFTINSDNRNLVFVKIKPDTWFLGHVQSFDDIGVGMIAGVHGYETDPGTITAHTLWVRYPSIRMAGMIEGIDLENNTVALERRNGDLVEVSVNDETTFRSRENTIHYLSDLEEGMAALIQTIVFEDKTSLAKNIIVFNPDRLPDFDVRFLGEVMSVSFVSISVETRSGGLVKFQVTEDTSFRSRGGKIRSTRDIAPGMWVAVGGTFSEDGDLIAETILVFHRIP